KTLAQRLIPSDTTDKKNVSQSTSTEGQGSLFDDNSSYLEYDILATSYATIQDTPHDYILVEDDETLQKCLAEAMSQKEIAIDTETTSTDALTAQLVGMSLTWQEYSGYYIPFDIHDNADTQRKLGILSPLLTREDVLWIAHNYKYD